MKYLKIANWSKWQTYRADRGTPPWIKIHRILLRNPEWLQLSDAQRGQIVSMWVLAADKDGSIPTNPTALQKILSLDSEPDLQLFMELGFIEHDANVASARRQDDANVTSARRQDDVSVTSSAPPPTASVQGSKGEEMNREAMTDQERMAPLTKWIAEANKETESPALVRFFMDELQRCLTDYYTGRGGRLTPTRLGYIGKQFSSRGGPDVGLASIEIFCDTVGPTKDERYLTGIARRISKLTTEQFDKELAEHRRRFAERGLWAAWSVRK